MQASSNAVQLIKASEGFKAHPYLCPAGVPTIGYGSTRYENGVKVTLKDKPISPERAELILLYVLQHEYAPAVSRYVTVPINQNQFDALLSFAYNLGAQALRTSTLLRLLNENKMIAAATEFTKWVWADGRKLVGLIKRREAERKLFLSESV